MDISNESHAEIEEDFPNISGQYRITSAKAHNHNCIAYAVGDLKNVWDPTAVGIPGYYWPPGLPTDDSLEGLVRVFELHGYRDCDNPELESGVDKVALYGDGTVWTHASAQLPTGKWTSKLGSGHDIEHDSLDALNSKIYGAVVKIMRRQKRATPA